MNINVMEQKMKENNVTTAMLSQMLNIDESTLYRKKKRSGKGFSVAEAQKIAQVLNLSASEASFLFFGN